MRRFLIACWLLAPVAVGAYHYGPGQDRMILDDAGQQIARAESLAAEARQTAADQGEEPAREVWEETVEAYEMALELLPEDRVAETRRLRLELCKAKMHVSLLPEANGELQGLVEELRGDPTASEELRADAQDALANSQYYMTWLLRLEGEGRERWEPEIESARQLYKQLVSEAEQRVDGERAARLREDLESAVRLARMDLDELQGLPLPGQ